MKQGITIGELIVNNVTDEHFNSYPNIDAKYGPYYSIESALAELTRPTRAVGLTVGIKDELNNITEYWFKGGIEDSHLVLKQSDVDMTNIYTKEEVNTKFDENNKDIDVKFDETNKDIDRLRQEVEDKTAETIVISDEEPVSKDALWLDTSDPTVDGVTNEELKPIVEAINAINQYLDTIVKQRDMIINPGDINNNLVDALLGKYEPIDPTTTPETSKTSKTPSKSIKINLTAIGRNETLEPDSSGYEPNTKAVRAKYGTLAKIQENFKKFVDYELIIATDAKRLYTKINGEPVNLSGTGGGSGGGSIDYEALDKLDTIGLVAPDGQIWRVKVNNNGQLVVYKKEWDTAQAEPTGGQEDPDTGWIYVTSLYLQKLYINSLYCGGLTSDEYSYNPCSHNFVELSNLTNNDISLEGLSLQYGTEGNQWQALPLWGNIKAGSTFLIRGAQCSVMDVNTTRIKVRTYDMEWRDDEGNLIKFDNRKAKFFLTWGKGSSAVANPYNNATSPIRVSKGYIDLVGLQIQNAGDADKVDAAESTPYGYLTSNYLFTKYYTMDPVNQATKALAKRNNANDMYFVDLNHDIIPRVESYTPRASSENKTIFFNKTLLDPTRPNKVTMTLGRRGTAPNASRCFNWVSVGYYDEYIWYRRVGEGGWTGQESIKNQTGSRKYYNRIRAITTDGTPFTTHKFVLTNLSAGEYEYYIKRNGDDSYKSPTYRFTVKNTNDILNHYKFIQTSDQQGFNWDEYQVWKISADYIRKHHIDNKDDSVDIEFMINTGDMTQNGNRINEWLDYDNGRESIVTLPEMVTVGNNDLTPANVYVLGDGGDNSKINATNIRFFYCFEMDEENPPIFQIQGKEVYIESLYSFDFGNTHYLCVNSEISSNTEKDVYGLEPQKVVYDYIKEWCMKDLERIDTSVVNRKIAFCHEMPFTIITQNLINSFYWDGKEDVSVERSGSRLNFNTSKANAYWFSKFLQENGYRLVLGGHKHTYICSYPLLENSASSMKPIIQVDAALLKSNFNSTELYEETAGELKGQKFPKSWENDNNYDMVKHLCTFELVSKITAPTYVMCQATGYKHTSNKELPSPNTPWLRYFFPATITINSKTDITAKVNAGQRYPFYIIHNIYNNRIECSVRKLANVFNTSGKYNINIQGLAPSATDIGGNGETNNGNDIITINL